MNLVNKIVGFFANPLTIGMALVVAALVQAQGDNLGGGHRHRMVMVLVDACCRRLARAAA